MISLSRNGQQIGSFSLEDINRMLASQQLNGTEHWWQEGMPNWQPLSALPGVAMPAPRAANPYQSPAGGYQGHPGHAIYPKTSGMAIASMVLGILSLILFFTHIFAAIMALLAIIFGHVALGSIRKSRGALTGRGMGITGLITGYLAMIVVATVIFVIGYFITKAANDPKFQKELEKFGQELEKSAEQGARQSRMQEELERISREARDPLPTPADPEQ